MTNETDVMPWGRYKGRKFSTLPAKYLEIVIDRLKADNNSDKGTMRRMIAEQAKRKEDRSRYD